MLLVRGVNAFPSAIREVVHRFTPDVSGMILVKPQDPGVRQEPPLPVVVELAKDYAGDPELAARIQKCIRDALVVAARVDLAPWGTLRHSEYKSKLVQR
jgi:phenylacetate-CoA ligase